LGKGGKYIEGSVFRGRVKEREGTARVTDESIKGGGRGVDSLLSVFYQIQGKEKVGQGGQILLVKKKSKGGIGEKEKKVRQKYSVLKFFGRKGVRRGDLRRRKGGTGKRKRYGGKKGKLKNNQGKKRNRRINHKSTQLFKQKREEGSTIFKLKGITLFMGKKRKETNR